MQVNMLAELNILQMSSRNKKLLAQKIMRDKRTGNNKQNLGFGRLQLNPDVTYSKSQKKKGKLSESMLLGINNFSLGVFKYGAFYDIDGFQFTEDQIPKISTDNLGEIKAENNVIDFGKDQYFKYVSRDGREHLLFTQKNCIGTPYSEFLRAGVYDSVTERYSYYWRYMLTKDPVYLGLSFTREEVQSYMEEAGMEPSAFFTVKMGGSESTKYYSAGYREGIIHSKEDYDEHYSHMTSGGILYSDIEPGSIFKIGGKEYALKEDHTLDIPYGADIYDIEYPKVKI